MGSNTLTPLSLAVNQTTPVNIPMDLGSVSYVKLTNVSPYLVLLSNIAGGRDWLQPGECNVWDVSGISTAIYATPQQLAQADTVPASVLVVTWFFDGEKPGGTFPVNFNILSYLGNNLVASSLVNDGNSVGTNIIESTPAGATQSYILVRNDGTFDVMAISNGVLTDIFHITPGTGGTPAVLNTRLLSALGVTKLDSGHIFTDGNGNLTVGNTTANSQIAAGSLALNASGGGAGGLGVPALTVGVNGTNTGGALYQLVDPGAGNYQAHQFYAVVNGSQVFLFQVGAPQGGSPPLAWLDAAGIYHGAGSMTLTSGTQESGHCGSGGYGVAPDTVTQGVNFKTNMTNTPTSLTFVAFANSNNTGPNATNLDKTGFTFFFNISATGTYQWNGTYTTVGNCLLAVDSIARTFDHHCDGCGAVVTAQPFARLRHERPALASGLTDDSLSYDCPCGCSETFNTALSAADEADSTPQGSGQYQTTRGAQATLIRALQAALGIATVL